jgi:glyoxylase-like metal-dependent hydrolase (beta-lactamase superfamily II)
VSVRIADRWFERRSIGDGVTLLWEPHVHPFLRCNIWHVRGRDADMLVDTGLGVASLRDAARDLFDKALLAVATHTHMDHTGGIHEFETRLVHESEAARMASGAGGWALDTSAWSAEALKHWAEIGYDLSGGLLDAHPHEGYDPRGHGLRPAAPTRTLAEGDLVDTGDRAFEVLHLPGHSPGSIGLWEAKTGTLFSGDALYDGPLLDEIEGADIPVYIETMKRLRELPVRVVHAGHDPSFGRARLIELCDAYLARRAR